MPVAVAKTRASVINAPRPVLLCASHRRETSLHQVASVRRAASKPALTGPSTLPSGTRQGTVRSSFSAPVYVTVYRSRIVPSDPCSDPTRRNVMPCPSGPRNASRYWRSRAGPTRMPPPTLIGCCGVVPKFGSSDIAQALFARVSARHARRCSVTQWTIRRHRHVAGSGGGAGGRGADAPVVVNDT